MIEYHLPWGIKNPAKLRNITSTIAAYEMQDAYFNVLKADAYGRICVDADNKQTEIRGWIADMAELAANVHINIPPDDAPMLLMPIAASGSGKSTVVTNLMDSYPSREFEHYALDECRHRFYDMDDYTRAWEMSCDDPKFKSRCMAEFMAMIKSGSNVYADNTNLSKKTRTFYTQEARKHGYNVVALLLPITREEQHARQLTRHDKIVPQDAYCDQYNKVQMPSIGEFDNIIVSTGNLPNIDPIE
jgi:predicted kinase